MRIIYFILFTLTFSLYNITAAQSQSDYADKNNVWHNGQIILDDGKVIEGDVSYNFVTQVLSHRDKSGSYSHNARNVSQFILQDKENDVSRKFYSLPLKLEGSYRPTYMFFERIHENNKVALLSRHVFVFKIKTTGYGDISNAGVVNVSEIEEIYEVLYLANNEKKLVPYAKRQKDKTKYVSRYASRRQLRPYDEIKTLRTSDAKYKIFKRKNAFLILTDHENEIKQYIKANGASTGTIPNLIGLLDYYAEITD